MTTKIELGLYGTHLGTRFLGYSIREKILLDFDSVEKIIFNFSGVETVSKSFADECFAKLLLDKTFEEVKAKTCYEGANPFIKAVIAGEMKERKKQQENEKDQ